MGVAVLHVADFGDAGGQPVVALHGICGHGGRWRRLAEQYTGGLHLYGLDLRGHGYSAWVPPWTLEQHAADVLATMDALRLERADLLGHSFGAAVAVYAARQAPERVRRLVLLDPAMELPPEVADARAQAALAEVTFDDRARALASQSAAWPQAPAKFVEDEVTDHLERTPDGRWRWRYHRPAVVAAYSEMARPALAPPAGVPTLLLRAGQDPTTPAAAYERLCRASDGVVLTAAAIDAGHMLYLDRPIEVGAALQDFLADSR